MNLAASPRSALTREQAPQEKGQGRLGAAKKQAELIRDQCPGEKFGFRGFEESTDLRAEGRSVLVLEDLPALDPSHDHVLEQPEDVKTRAARHGHRLARRGKRRSCEVCWTR